MNTKELMPLDPTVIRRSQDCILRLNEVKTRTGLSRSSIYAYMKTGNFPAHVLLGVRCVGWDEDAVQDWILAKLESAKKRAAHG